MSAKDTQDVSHVLSTGNDDLDRDIDDEVLSTRAKLKLGHTIDWFSGTFKFSPSARPSSYLFTQEIEAMKQRVKEMEAEAAKLREMQAQAEKDMNMAEEGN